MFLEHIERKERLKQQEAEIMQETHSGFSARKNKVLRIPRKQRQSQPNLKFELNKPSGGLMAYIKDAKTISRVLDWAILF